MSKKGLPSVLLEVLMVLPILPFLKVTLEQYDSLGSLAQGEVFRDVLFFTILPLYTIPASFLIVRIPFFFVLLL